MDNVTPLFGNHDAIQDQIGNVGYGPADFEISEAPVFYRDNEGVEHPANRKMIYRKDTGEALGLHGLGYETVDHKMMIDASRNVLERSGLDLRDMRESIAIGAEGSMCYIQHTLPEHRALTPDGDTVSLQLLHLNSHNGVWSYQGSAGGLQSACMNTQIFMKNTLTMYKARHTEALDIDKGARILTGTIGMLNENNDIWHEWANITVSREEVFRTIAEASGSKFTLGKLKEGLSIEECLELPTCYNNSALTYMCNEWGQYKAKMGQNYWALFNTLTHWSTHFFNGKRTNATDSSVQYIKNSETVRDVIQQFPKAA